MLALTRPVFIIILLSPSYCLIWAFIPRYRRAACRMHDLYNTDEILINSWLNRFGIYFREIGCFEKYCFKQVEETSHKRSKKRILLLRAFGPWIEHLHSWIHELNIRYSFSNIIHSYFFRYKIMESWSIF